MGGLPTYSGGGISALTDDLLAAVDFPSQVQLPLEEVPQPLWEFYFEMFMTDAKAVQQMLGIKPSSAYKPCGTIANLVGRVPVRNVTGPYLQHYSCAGTALWDPWTSERWHDAARLVADEWGVSAERGERMETMLGIYHNGGRGLPYSARAPLYRLPAMVQWRDCPIPSKPNRSGRDTPRPAAGGSGGPCKHTHLYTNHKN